MNKEEEKHIDELVNKFNNMTKEEQQREIKALYITHEILYTKMSEKYFDAVKRLIQIQQQFKDKQYF